MTLFDMDPDPGIKVKRIMELQNDLALALAAPTVRIQAPVPGRPVVGIEIPNTISTTVTIREMLESEGSMPSTARCASPWARVLAAKSVSIDLAAMPHLLIAGATGSGKSVMLNVLISSLLFQNTPDDVRLLMIDPKMVELTIYNGDAPPLQPRGHGDGQGSGRAAVDDARDGASVTRFSAMLRYATWLDTTSSWLSKGRRSSPTSWWSSMSWPT